MAQILFDTHVHSCFSVDSDELIENIYNKAVNMGLKAVTVTDHYDIDLMHLGLDEQVLGIGYDELIKWRSKTAHADTKLLCGIELGAAVCDKNKAKSIVDEHEYDVIIGSIHGISGKPEYYMMDFVNMSRLERMNVIEDYFKHQVESAKLSFYDILAHLDYPIRYIREKKIDFSLLDFADYIDEIIKAVAENGKALEINSKNYCREFDFVVKRFHELGGEMISFGSDAHSADRLCADFDLSFAVAKQAGFDKAVYFEKRKPVFVDIE